MHNFGFGENVLSVVSRCSQPESEVHFHQTLRRTKTDPSRMKHLYLSLLTVHCLRVTRDRTLTRGPIHSLSSCTLRYSLAMSPFVFVLVSCSFVVNNKLKNARTHILNKFVSTSTRTLEIREHPPLVLYVPDLKYIPVNTKEDFQNVLNLGNEQ
jgi:hypothetical protein